MNPFEPPHGPAAECDLVLKGGITSGVVYPGAIIALGRAFRLRNIGGTSAGAIGGAVAAAAEFRRQTNGHESFAEAFTELVEDLGTPGFTADLLQPTPATRPLMRMLLAGLEQGKSLIWRVISILGLLLRAHAWLPPLLFGCAAVLAWLTVRAPGPAGWLTALLVTILVLVAAVGSVLGCAMLLALAVMRSLNAAENGFAMCSGMPTRGTRPALTPWLHATIQHIAGVDPTRPLTFEDLRDEGIRLALVTTDLSNGQPVSLPIQRSGEYWFDPADMDRLMPAAVAAHMRDHSKEDYVSGLRALPADRLPVVVAVRMSLSVPLLIAAIPLYGCDPKTRKPSRDHRVWFTDGGVTSNFPITFFDAWLPSRPTFGLDLRPHPQPLATRSSAGKPEDEEMVVLPDRDDGFPPSLWQDVAGVGVFIRQLVDALMNWRDTAQSRLPGYRDRVCQIHLAQDEGGLNLNMSAETIAGLHERGRIAGTKLADRFDVLGRSSHMTGRYLLLMRLLQRELDDTGEKLDKLCRELHEGLAEREGYRNSEAALQALVDAATGWQQGARPVDFDPSPAPAPTPIMRAGPKT